MFLHGHLLAYLPGLGMTLDILSPRFPIHSALAQHSLTTTSLHHGLFVSFEFIPPPKGHSHLTATEMFNKSLVHAEKVVPKDIDVSKLGIRR